MTNTTTDLRLQLLNAGYTPVPCQGKKVHLLEWTSVAIDAAEIERWEKKQHWDNTGIRTQYTPAFDIDITDDAAADAVAEKVQKKFEDHGQILVRTGKAPKRAIPFRTDQPFLKITRDFIAPNGSEQKIEFLGEGQQFVAFGIHPDTEQPYRWHGGDPSTVPLADLPYISSAEAYNRVDDVVVLLTIEFGYTPLSVRRNKTKQQSKDNDNATLGRFVWSPGFGGKKLKEICEVVRKAQKGEWDAARRKAFMFGRWVGGGAYDVDQAWKELERAAKDCNAPEDYPGEFKRAFFNGVNQPASPFIEDTPLDDFRAYLPLHSYIYIPTRELWPASSVNARIPSVDDKLKASTWLDKNRCVEQMTWAPGEEMLIPNRLISEGGWIQKNDVTCFNLYRPPTIEPGDAGKAGPWIEHVHKVFGDDAEHIIKWCAQRVQHPDIKINHALVLGSEKQGIGKDAMLEPVKRTVGPWNFGEVGPQQLLGRFNGFLKNVILRVNEARDLGDINRYQFYEHTKALTAAPPDSLRVDEKHMQEHNILNCVGIILTTNYKTNGIYLPAEDRRHYVAWSNLAPEDFAGGYWNKLWGWYDTGGGCHVAAYLAGLDLAGFDPKVPPPKTEAFWDIVDANRAPEDSELADVLDELGNPPAVTVRDVIEKARNMRNYGFVQWLQDHKNRRLIPHRFEKCGYVPVRNPDRQDRMWKIRGQRQVVYALSILSLREQLEAARACTQEF